MKKKIKKTLKEWKIVKWSIAKGQKDEYPENSDI